MKIALVYSDDFSLWVFRRGLISALIKKGHSVSLICPKGKYMELLEKMGAKHVPIYVNRFFSPIKDLKLLFNLYQIFQKSDFDLVHTFTVKPNIFGVIAAKLAKVKLVVLSITGVGILKEDEYSRDFKMRLIRFVLKNAYRITCNLVDKVSFQNKNDIIFFIKNGILSQTKDVLVESSGVNLNWFSFSALSAKALDQIRQELYGDNITKIVSMVARPLWNKGVTEFIDASNILSPKYPFVKFVLVGGIEEGNHLSMSGDHIRKKETNNFKWLGFRDDIREIQYLSDISVLPSYYPEGIPRNLLEAMAMENPVVTTDNVGCREVVENGRNGFLVPTRDAKALADAIEKLILDDDKRREFGRYSRKKVETQFDDRFVVENIVTKLYNI